MLDLKKALVLAASVSVLPSGACDRSTNPPASERAAAAAVPAGHRFPAGPTRPAPTVRLQPLDLTTSVGASPLHVLVSNLGEPVGADLLNQIAGAVSLKTWPEMANVATTVAQIVDASGRSDQDQFAHIYLRPAAPLTDRWYALHVAALPQGAAWPTFSSGHDIKNGGGKVSRFRVGSEPVVAGVRAYVSDPAKQVVYVDFSERVTGDARALSLSHVGGAATNCRVDNTDAVVTDGTNAGMTAPAATAKKDTSISSVRLICPGTVDLRRGLQLDLPPGLRSTSGPSINAGRPIQLIMGAERWMDWGDGGRLFRPAT